MKDMRSKQCDVLVIGGGAAGIAAACTAARSGAEVVLLERLPFLGGMATAAYVGTVCGLYYRSASSARYVHEGFPQAFAEMLRERSEFAPQMFDEHLWYLPYALPDFGFVSERLVKQAGVELSLHTTIYQSQTESRRIISLDATNSNQAIRFVAASVIDCSGEAVVSLLAGAEICKSESPQAAAIVFELSGLPPGDEKTLRNLLYLEITRGVRAGDLPEATLRFSLVPGQRVAERVLCKLAVDHPGSEPNDITAAEIQARDSVDQIAQYLRKSISALKVSFLASQLGVRTGRRGLGKYVLTEKDVLTCAKHQGSLAKGAWPVEFWGAARQPEMGYLPFDESYDIPNEALQSLALENLFFAGRGVSATERAAGSARVIGTCFSTGEAAGLLAARSANRR